MAQPAPDDRPAGLLDEMFPDAVDPEALIRELSTAAGYDPDAPATADELALLRRFAEIDDDAVDDAPWLIRTQDEAEWAMVRYARATAHLDTLKAQRDAWVERATAWYNRTSAWAQRDAAFFGAHLEAYALRVRAASPTDSKGEPKVKRLVTMFGEVPTRGGGKRVVKIADPERLVAWVTELGKRGEHLAKVTTEVQVTTLRKYAHVDQATGAVKVEVVDSGTGELVPATVPDGLVVAEPPEVTASTPKPDHLAIEAAEGKR